jgi:site-specific DNA-cytosine methylase
MNIVSLFDGMSCARIALDRANIKVSNYYASEVDKHSIAVSKNNYSDIIQIGDITKVSYKCGILYTENGEFNVGNIDLLIGGSPCQSISLLGDRTGFDGKSGLFWHYHRLLKEINPEYFVLENVKGSPKLLDVVSKEVGADYVNFNSNLLSAQNRKRVYWSNIKYDLPANKNIKLIDVLDKEQMETSELTKGRFNWFNSEKGKNCLAKGYSALDPLLSNCLTARSDASWNSNYVTRNGIVTKLSCEEYEKLQTVPVGYTSCVRSSQRYKMLGNGMTVDVIAHILSAIVI